MSNKSDKHSSGSDERESIRNLNTIELEDLCNRVADQARACGLSERILNELLTKR